MGNLFNKEEDPLEAKFLGMKFRCDKAHFAQAIKEEFELLFLVPYLILWVQIKLWGALGIVWKKGKVVSEGLRSNWNAGVNVATSRAWHQWNEFELLGNFGAEWMVCDPIMFKYWIVHGINRFIPELESLGDDKEIVDLILDFPRVVEE